MIAWSEKYHILQTISKKEDTKVMIAKHKQLGVLRLIKEIKKASQFYGQLSKEAFLMKRLNHASIPQIFDLEENEQFLYIIEQYIEGETLTSYCEKGVMPEKRLLYLGEQLCEVVQYLHSQNPPIYHLDLKPDNLIISNDHIWLVDFGSAITKDQQKGVIFGTPMFACPEQRRGEKPNGQWDIYSIGILLSYMAGGRKLEWNLECSPLLKRIIQRCIHPKPFLRYQKVDQIVNALNNCKKKRKTKEKQNPFRIAIAGIKSHSGTTHISLLLCSFLKNSSSKVLYLEKNKSGMLQELALRSQWKFEKQKELPFCFRKKGFYLAKQSFDHSFGNLPENVLDQFEWIVEDYGKLEEINQEVFIEADFRFVILGGREWELKCLEEGFKSFSELQKQREQTVYLFNLTEKNRCHVLAKQMEKRHCERISYEPDPFECGTETTVLFSDVLKEMIKGD